MRVANFKIVNREIKRMFKLDIEVVRGEGYVYFELADYDIPSIYVNPTSISTSDLVRLVWNHLIDSVADWSK
tara:strand:- start:8314 stop:8529 length:216 start_codon:yes stop_codon:yes gene_type:complete